MTDFNIARHIPGSELELLDNEVRRVQQASGIRIWTVVDDTTDHTSLLRAIHAELEATAVH